MLAFASNATYFWQNKINMREFDALNLVQVTSLNTFL